MSLTLVLVALTQAFTGSTTSNKWLDDYSAGYQQATAQRKPLAVFVGRGPLGYNAVAQEGQLDKQTQLLLRDHYVSVYVDAAEESNQQLVQRLKAEGMGLVLSDPTGEYVAFRHAGAMTKDQLGSTLKLYSEQGTQAAPPPAAGAEKGAAPAPAQSNAPATCGQGGCWNGSCGYTCGSNGCSSGCFTHGCRSHGCRTTSCRTSCGHSRSCGSHGCRSYSRCGSGGCGGGCR